MSTGLRNTMSSGRASRDRSRSTASQSQHSQRSHHSQRSLRSGSGPGVRHTPPPTTLTPENSDATLEPCAATASFLLYAQRDVVLVLHHDTLAIERRFTLHREDVRWISVDNVSERGFGRLAVSYDAGNTAIVWDIFTGGEVARFSAYETMQVAAFMRNGNIAFGNEHGNIVLFEPSTSEHISARTIYDAITAIAPSADCSTFAIGYTNGSILIATLRPSFTILHTLTTTRAPSRIMGLAWHGSSSKQKTDMLATQTMDGDLRVWSVPKPPHQDAPNIIRVLQRAEIQHPGPCWFAWSKNGRIVQHAEGETRSWDVRTKKVSWEVIPTAEGVTGVAAYGPSATLFTLNRNHSVRQYDIAPSSVPAQVASVQHVPANTPPTPPTNLEEIRPQPSEGERLHPQLTDTEESSADEGGTMSPLQKIAKEMDSLDALEDEIRDKVTPLSPTSSRASSASSRSSGARQRSRRYLYDRPGSSRASSTSGYNGTEFSLGTPPLKKSHDSISIQSASSYAPHARSRNSNLRKEVLRSPEEAQTNANMDLFPHTRARLREVPFRTPHYGSTTRTAELLQREMLSTVFGWNDTARALIRDEMQRQKPGSASSVLLAKWLGDIAADNMASMVGSETMTSSDWMLLALSSIGTDSQKKVGEAFVQRLLEKGDVHPAVAILLGLGENHDAIEVYVSQHYWMEACLLTCLTSPSDWQRISFLIRKWGEAAVQQGQAELAVRCFSCTSIETSEPWFSPRAQDAVYAAQQERFMQPMSPEEMNSPPLSPPSRHGSERLAAKNASLKLITNFGDKGAPLQNDANATPMQAAGFTPIAQTALSPGGAGSDWPRMRNVRDPSSARTATPGGYTRKKRLPSRSDIERAKREAANMATPETATREQGPFKSMPTPSTALKATTFPDERFAPSQDSNPDNHLPSPAQGVFHRLREQSGSRTGHRRPQAEGLAVEVHDTRYADTLSPDPSTGASASQNSAKSLPAGTSPLPTGGSAWSKGRAVDEYISSVDLAREQAREARGKSRRRNESRPRDQSRAGRGASRPREPSASRERNTPRYIKPAKRSPSSPVPMSPEEIAQASQQASGGAEPATTDDESFYKLASPVSSQRSRNFSAFDAQPRASQEGRPSMDDPQPPPPPPPPKARSRAASRQLTVESAERGGDDGRGRTDGRKEFTLGRSTSSPASPLPRLGDAQMTLEPEHFNRVDDRVGRRAPSRSRDLQSRRAASRPGRDRSTGRTPGAIREDEVLDVSPDKDEFADDNVSESSVSASAPGATRRPRPRGMSRKELAAKELEERRMSLARRPSAPSIPMPGHFNGGMRPPLGPRSNTDLSASPSSHSPPYTRSHTADPESMSRNGRTTGTSTTSAPIGLPATPRAMRHPRYMNTDHERDAVPPVPDMPDNASQLSSLGSSLTQTTESELSQASSGVSSMPRPEEENDEDAIGPLLPSTVFGQKGPQAPPERSMSAPMEKVQVGVHPAYKPHLPQSNRRKSHVRKISPPEVPQGQGSSHHANVPSIDEALSGPGGGEHNHHQNIVVVPEQQEAPPPMLPELQHLAGPPPPPPPPTMYSQQQHRQTPSGTNHSGVINIAIADDPPNPSDVPTSLPEATYPQKLERAITASPSVARRGSTSVSESLGSRWRGFGDKMRSGSRSRAKSPAAHHQPQQQQDGSAAQQHSGIGRPSPYETVLPPFPGHGQGMSTTTGPPPGHGHSHSLSHSHRRTPSATLARAKSPYEQAMADNNTPSHHHQSKTSQHSNNAIPPPPPPPPAPPGPGYDGTRITETAIPPSSLPPSRSASAMGGFGGYRNPKEIRANMPPEALQNGVGMGGFL